MKFSAALWVCPSLCALSVAVDGSCKDGACAASEGAADTTAMLQFAVPAGSAVQPDQAVLRADKRHRLKVEDNLMNVFRQHMVQKSTHLKVSRKHGPESCSEQAKSIFDVVVLESALAEELHPKELASFKQRFASAMKSKCKDLTSETMWHEIGAQEFDRQKPVMTAALVTALNQAGLGFKAKMHAWLVHESLASLPGRLGLLPRPKDQESILKRHPARRSTDAALPETFLADQKWPACANEILRIHNQGHCGSCWAFGGLASMDARMCIASNGTWNAPEDILSRLHVTSCAPDTYWQGSDGCQGGFPHWPMEYMAKHGGVASTSCLPYYIGGEGSEHFEQQDTAPPCETHCQGGYSVSLNQDKYHSSGVGNYDWLTEVHGDLQKIYIMKIAIYEEGPVSFAFCANGPFMGYAGGVFSVCTGQDQANHAVYAYGWGKELAADGSYVEFAHASNSWGTDWGVDGHFKIHPRCITDVVIAGTIETDVVGHVVGEVDSSVPLDPANEYWPWSAPDECPFIDGCVSDLEMNDRYTNDEKCTSKALIGKRIHVAEFDTEYGYDVLQVNGMAFSGKEGHGFELAALEGIEVSTEIKFSSDSSVAGPGFKLCEI